MNDDQDVGQDGGRDVGRVVRLARADGVASITLCNPDRANAMGPEFFAELSAALDEVAEDADLRAVVLRGEGRHFCAGGDLAHPLFDERDPNERKRQIEEAYAVTGRMLDLPLPIVCAVQGRVAGAATALVLASDVRVAARSAVFSLDFVRLGLSPDMGVCWLLAPAIGTGRALEMAITGELVPADRAEAWGLIGRVVDDGTEGAVADELARKLTQHPRAAYAAIRRLVRTAPSMPRQEGFDAEIASMNALIESSDAQERLAAFRARSRRAPG